MCVVVCLNEFIGIVMPLGPEDMLWVVVSCLM